MQTLSEQDKSYLKKAFPCLFHTIRLGKYELSYIDEGHGTGPVLLMLHACPQWSFEFRHLIFELRNDYRILAIDQLGFGLSDKPLDADYHIENHADHLDWFIHELGISDLILIAHGRGTAIGMAFAVRHPDMIRGIITLNAMCFSNFVLPIRLQLCRFKWLGAQMVYHLNIFQRDVAKLPKDVQRGYTLPFPNAESKIAFLKFIQDLPCAPEEDSAQTMIETESSLWLLQDIPACIVWGAKDWLYKQSNLTYWQKRLPQAEVYVLKDAGRYLLEEAKEKTVEIISDFLKRNFSEKNATNETARI